MTVFCLIWFVAEATPLRGRIAAGACPESVHSGNDGPMLLSANDRQA